MQSTAFIMHPRRLSTNTITLIVLAANQRGCMINAIDCIYFKLPTEDEQFIYSKHVEDIIRTNLKIKCISLVLITQIYHDARSI